MKKKLLIFTLLCLIMPVCLLFSACNEAPNNEVSSTQNQEAITAEEYISNDAAWGLITEADYKLELKYLDEFNNVSIETKYDFLNGGEAYYNSYYDETLYFVRNTIADPYIIKRLTQYSQNSYSEGLFFEYNGENYYYSRVEGSSYSYERPSLQGMLAVSQKYNKEDLLYCKKIQNDNYLIKFYKNHVDSENDYLSYTVLCEVVLSGDGLYQSRNEYIKTNTSSGTYNKKQNYVYGNVSYTELNNYLTEAISHL